MDARVKPAHDGPRVTIIGIRGAGRVVLGSQDRAGRNPLRSILGKSGHGAGNVERR